MIVHSILVETILMASAIHIRESISDTLNHSNLFTHDKHQEEAGVNPVRGVRP